MKKVIYSLVVLVILILCSNTVLAAQSASFGISLTSSKTNVNRGDEITVILRVKDFENMTEGIYAFLATIEYDENFFEKLTESSVKGLETWSSVPTFNPNNGQITADSGTGIAKESDVFSITFKIKETAEIGKSTQIVVKNFEASEGEEDIIANEDAKIIINIVESSNTGNNSGNTNSGNINNANTNNGSTNIGNNSNGNLNVTDNKNTEELPKTGEYDYIIFFIIGIAVVVAGCGYFGYKKYIKV